LVNLFNHSGLGCRVGTPGRAREDGAGQGQGSKRAMVAAAATVLAELRRAGPTGGQPQFEGVATFMDKL